MRTGQQVGQYRVIAELGRGGMGTVFSAEDTKLRRTVAIKLAQDNVSDDTSRRRLLREARAAAAVSHPNLAAVYEVGEADGTVFIAMEMVGGGSLRTRLERGPIELPEALRIARELVAGLSQLHSAGIIHRDLKPDNVLFADDGRVKLVDFGIAKARALVEADVTVTREGELLGTPSYMSPEQAEGRPVDERSDVFSLGAVLYELVSGRRAFAGDSSAQVLASVLRDSPLPLIGIPRDLVRVIDRCLEKDPAERWPTTQRIADVLAVVRLDSPPEAEPPAPLPPVIALSPQSRRRWVIGALGVSTAALLVVITWQRADRTGQPTWQPAIAEMPELHTESVALPALSPDGTLVAYVSDREDLGGIPRIYVEPFDRVDPSRSWKISPVSGEPTDLRWTSDGSSLLEAGPRGLFRVPLRGTPSRLRPESFSADACGAQIISFEPIQQGCAGCFHVVMFGGDRPEREVMRLTPREYPKRVRCAPDARRALVEVWRSHEHVQDIQVIDLESTLSVSPPIARIDDQGVAQPTFGPDGQSIIASRGVGLQGELFEISLDGTRQQQLLGGGLGTIPDVSRDGSRLMFINGQAQTRFLLSASSAGRSRAIATNFVPFYGPTITPDGTTLIITHVDLESRREIYAYATDGSTPSGHRIGPGRPWGVTADGREVIATQWAADGTLPIVAFPLAGGAPRRLGTLSVFPRDVRIGADHRVHFTDQADDKFTAVSIPLEGGERAIDAPSPIILVVPMANGYRLTEVGASELRSELHIVKPDAPLDSPDAHVLIAKAYAIDGPTVVYTVPGDRTLRRYDPRTGRDDSLPLVTRKDFEFAISPDGTTVYSPAVETRSRLQLITNLATRPRL